MLSSHDHIAARGEIFKRSTVYENDLLLILKFGHYNSSLTRFSSKMHDPTVRVFVVETFLEYGYVQIFPQKKYFFDTAHPEKQ